MKENQNPNCDDAAPHSESSDDLENFLSQPQVIQLLASLEAKEMKESPDTDDEAAPKQKRKALTASQTQRSKDEIAKKKRIAQNRKAALAIKRKNKARKRIQLTS